MKYYTITAICIAVIVMSGCGVARKGKSGGPAVVNEVYGDVDVVRHVSDVDNHLKRTQPVSAEPLSRPGQQRDVRATIEFSARECEHVRLPGIHILPDGGVTLDLEALRSEFCYPYHGKFISDYGYRGGRMHTGIDIKAAPNDTIRAVFAGVVRMSKGYSGYGNIVVIRHYNGIETLYGHNSRNLVKANDMVEAGDPIALAGRTGRATTEHLHFEVRAGGEHLDPKMLIDPNDMCLRPGMLLVQQTAGRVIASSSGEDLTHSSKQLVANAGSASVEYKAAAVADYTASANQNVYYTVKNGDTLSAIARRHSTTVSKICGLNNLSNPDRLRLGQKLRIR